MNDVLLYENKDEINIIRIFERNHVRHADLKIYI